MKQPTAVTYALLSLMLFGEGVSAFCPSLSVQQQQKPRSSCLKLMPGQGSQLVAAYTAATSSSSSEDVRSSNEYLSAEKAAPASPQQQDNEPPSSSSHWRALAASRSFVSRVFHKPSSAIKKHPHPTLEGLKTADAAAQQFPYNFIPSRLATQDERKQDDVVLYPIVGFRFFNQQGSSIALPTTSHAACRLPTNRNEDVYGWFTPACRLDLYAEDVCHEPEVHL
jgi:hypothetical protein